MFDPFADFAIAGYLRNHFGEKDPEIVRTLEHQVFRAGVDDAFALLAARPHLHYEDFLEVHGALFSDLYPWAGQDRSTTAPGIVVSKERVLFCHPKDCRRAVEEGLRLAQRHGGMRAHCGEIMGLFAYGHPFLDGNGRTMLVIHTELCDRAGFAIDWHRIGKYSYLQMLSAEIETPGNGLLDGFLAPFVVERNERNERSAWGASLGLLKGLDGAGSVDRVEGSLDDPAVSRSYQAFDEKRAYRAR